MINTQITQDGASSDCVGSSPAEAVALAAAWAAGWEADISPAGASAGDLLDMSQANAYTPNASDINGHPGPLQ